MPKSYEARLAEWAKARFAPPPEPDLLPREPTLRAMAPMRDGVRLYTEVYLPSGGGRFPVVLVRSPYPYSRPSRDDRRPISRYLEAGFAFVFQLTRGQYLSEGVFRFLTDDIADGADCICWIASQEWCDGNVGMEGASYLGSAQFMAARARPPALKCIMPTAFPGHRDKPFHTGGIPARGWALQWHVFADMENMSDLDFPYGETAVLKHARWGPALRRRPLSSAAEGILRGDKLASFEALMRHARDDAAWASLRFTDAELAAVDLPMFITGGWLDPSAGPVEYFERLESLGLHTDRYLLVGPWNHFQAGAAHLHGQDNGDRKMPASGAFDLIGSRLAFFDRYLRENKDSQVQEDRVRVFLTGADVWRNYPTFPPPDVKERPLYLHSAGRADSFPGDGELSWSPPGDEAPDTYVYDPSFPTLSEVEAFRDRRDIEVRGDVLTYTSDAFERPLTILGGVKLVLFAASNAPDTDWWAALTEVFSDGRSVAFHGFISGARARLSGGPSNEITVTSNTPTRFEIPLGYAGHQLAAGSRLRLSICSANFPGFDANTNTGDDPWTDTHQRMARQTVFHDAMRASHLIVPTLELL